MGMNKKYIGAIIEYDIYNLLAIYSQIRNLSIVLWRKNIIHVY